MENLRRVVQVLSFAAFVYLFVMTIGRFDFVAKQNVLMSKAPIDTVLPHRPAAGRHDMIATRRVIWMMLIYGLPVVILTVLAGRFFCGWICPLGTTLDATDTVFFRKRKAHQAGAQPSPAISSTTSSQACSIAAAFGSQFAYLMDPITIITRAFTFVAVPNRDAGHRRGHQAAVCAAATCSISSGSTSSRRRCLIGILAANAISRRYWCRNLCPLGALLGLLSRFSIVRRIVKSDCIGCKKCIPDCKMGAILDDPTAISGPGVRLLLFVHVGLPVAEHADRAVDHKRGLSRGARSQPPPRLPGSGAGRSWSRRWAGPT